MADRYYLLTEKYEKVLEENVALKAEIERVWKKNLQEVTTERDYFKLYYEISTRVTVEMFKSITQEQLKKQIENEIAIELSK
jgi:hypothetical protein